MKKLGKEIFAHSLYTATSVELRNTFRREFCKKPGCHSLQGFFCLWWKWISGGIQVKEIMRMHLLHNLVCCDLIVATTPSGRLAASVDKYLLFRVATLPTPDYTALTTLFSILYLCISVYLCLFVYLCIFVFSTVCCLEAAVPTELYCTQPNFASLWYCVQLPYIKKLNYIAKRDVRSQNFVF